MEVCYLLRQRWLYLSLQIPDEPLLSGTMIPFSIKNDEGSLLIEVYSDGVFIESFVIQ